MVTALIKISHYTNRPAVLMITVSQAGNDLHVEKADRDLARDRLIVRANLLLESGTRTQAMVPPRLPPLTNLSILSILRPCLF